MSRTDSIELRPHSMRGISSFSSSPHSVRSSSVTTTSASDPDDVDYLADRSRSDGSENSTPWLCCASRGGRKEKRGSELDDVPITPSTPPQHRRFSWEAHDDDESRSSPDSDSSGSTLGSEHQRDQSTVSPIFARLPCLRRKQPEPEAAPEEIELQDIVVSREDSSSIYSQSAASVEDLRNSSSTIAATTKDSARGKFATYPLFKATRIDSPLHCEFHSHFLSMF